MTEIRKLELLDGKNKSKVEFKERYYTDEETWKLTRLDSNDYDAIVEFKLCGCDERFFLATSEDNEINEYALFRGVE